MEQATVSTATPYTEVMEVVTAPTAILPMATMVQVGVNMGIRLMAVMEQATVSTATPYTEVMEVVTAPTGIRLMVAETLIVVVQQILPKII
ncbi:hypothetical protein A3D78_01295 [Candidatus Gottesmanbacteria bacterium RIFCSPHIGHO2_02_FULL_39_14]|uniref:Uncharacterized protein n=1 Tax=Candidatus Gottesmanbacteria bacterium RIFCSPHIGHO2_02_FULL_39_14 TaxID=1798383 RepID=A0A1F6A3T7_9BACT|nr:MAG: hypothetical protein A3D78_01295 [Candidatus Gottesmanbacteria bacterium RIFCSPHIGHO2_02_FULL_39_14]